jgi:hypothetical protein
MVPLSDHPVPLQVEAGLAEPWLGCDAEPTRKKQILFSSFDKMTCRKYFKATIPHILW